MTTSPEGELPSPTSTTAATPPKPPRRKRDRGAEPDGASNATSAPKTSTAPKTDDTVVSTAGAPTPPKRGRRNAGGATSALTAAAASAAAAPPAAKAAAPKADPAPAARSTPPSSKLPPVVAPVIAMPDVDAEAVLIDGTPVPAKPRARDIGGVTTGQASTPTVVASGSVAAVRSERHFRQTLTKVDLWSVTKLSLCFYLSAMFVTVVAIVALWLIASAAGIVHSVEKFLGDLLSARNFHFLSATVLRGSILVGLVVVALQVVITVISASFYNIFSELFGGVEITVREEGPAE